MVGGESDPVSNADIICLDRKALNNNIIAASRAQIVTKKQGK